MIKAENQTKTRNEKEKVNKRHEKQWISHPSFRILEYNKDLKKKKKKYGRKQKKK